MKCMHCKFDFLEGEIEEHHIHPRFMDNKKGEGMKINLCRDCHIRLHLNLPSLYWKVLTKEQRKISIDVVMGFSKWWGKI